MLEFNRNSHKSRPPGWPDDLSWPADKQSVIAAVHRRGQTVNGLSLAAGFSESLIRVALYSRRSATGEQLLADFLGVSRQALFDPGFWDRSRMASATTSPTSSQKPAAPSGSRGAACAKAGAISAPTSTRLVSIRG